MTSILVSNRLACTQQRYHRRWIFCLIQSCYAKCYYPQLGFHDRKSPIGNPKTFQIILHDISHTKYLGFTISVCRCLYGSRSRRIQRSPGAPVPSPKVWRRRWLQRRQQRKRSVQRCQLVQRRWRSKHPDLEIREREQWGRKLPLQVERNLQILYCACLGEQPLKPYNKLALFIQRKPQIRFEGFVQLNHKK